MREFRRETRKETTAAVELSWEIGAGYTRSLAATMKDLSSKGMGLVVTMPLALGLKLKIKSGDKTHQAVVKRCVRGTGTYLLGVQFER